MNERRNDDAMDRDLDELGTLYREAPGYDDEPPASLDSAILAAAHREVHSRPQSQGKSRLTRWQVPLATAAVIVVSSSVALIGIQESPEPARTQSAAPANAPQAEIRQRAKEEAPALDALSNAKLKAPPPEAAPLKPEPPAATAMKKPAAAAKQRAETSAPKMDSPAPAAAESVLQPSPFPASPRQAAETEKEIGTQREYAPAQATGINRSPAKPAPVAAKALPPADEKAVVTERSAKRAEPYLSPSPNAETSPEAWLAKIERLYQEGRIDEAKASLAKFRQTYPQYAIPESLKMLGK